MARGHSKNLASVGGEIARWMLLSLNVALFAPDKLPQNPWRERPAESPALKRHRENWNSVRWKGTIHALRE